MSMKLYVGNLSFETTDQDLKKLFEQVGTVEQVSIVQDRDTGRSRGFAFVEMSSKEEGMKGIEQFNGTEIQGRTITVNEARPREERGGGGGGYRGGGGGGRDRNSRGDSGGSRSSRW